MKILSLALYGSCARGDQTEGSDVDLFAIHDQKEYRMSISGNVNTALYPEEKALKMMRAGSLFALHLKMQSKAVFNEEKHLGILNEFKYKDNYDYEIIMASKLGRDILSCSEKVKNDYMFNRRLSWCVRTILIAASAQNKNPIFSKNELIDSMSFLGVEKALALKIINLKNQHKKDESLNLTAKVFFDTFWSEGHSLIKKVEGDYFYIKSIKSLLSDSCHDDRY